jgi:Peptidase propeptide and YPEB domain
MSSRVIKIAAAVSIAAALALGGAAWAIAGGGDDDGPGATGPDAEKAKAAALAHLGGGTANEVERGDEEGAYEVEVTKPDGGTVDVHLDESFEVIGVEGDSENEDESGENEE